MLRSKTCFNFPSGKCLANSTRKPMTSAIKIKKANGLIISASAKDVCSGVMPKV